MKCLNCGTPLYEIAKEDGEYWKKQLWLCDGCKDNKKAQKKVKRMIAKARVALIKGLIDFCPSAF